MTYLVQWTPRGHVFPRAWTFWAPDAAEHFAEILRELGHQHVTTHHLNSTEEQQ